MIQLARGVVLLIPLIASVSNILIESRDTAGVASVTYNLVKKGHGILEIGTVEVAFNGDIVNPRESRCNADDTKDGAIQEGIVHTFHFPGLVMEGGVCDQAGHDARDHQVIPYRARVVCVSEDRGGGVAVVFNYNPDLVRVFYQSIDSKIVFQVLPLVPFRALRIAHAAKMHGEGCQFCIV